MGQDAVDINKTLLEVIRPYVARLSVIGVLHNRDYQTVWFHMFYNPIITSEKSLSAD